MGAAEAVNNRAVWVPTHSRTSDQMRVPGLLNDFLSASGTHDFYDLVLTELDEFFVVIVKAESDPSDWQSELIVLICNGYSDMAPAFRRPFHKRRCLIPATGFYEWKKTPEGKISYSIEMKDAFPFVFAGLWDGWQNPDTKEWLRSCMIITGGPNELVGQIHNRMPVILPPESHEQWPSGEGGKEILRPFPAEEMAARRISKRINKPENNDPSVLEEDEMEQTGRLI
jgi:hypothetical protein